MNSLKRTLFASLAFLWVHSPLSATPALLFFNNLDQIAADGVTPGGDVLFLSNARERADWTPQVVSRLDFAAGDNKGLAILGGVSVVDPSIWAVVDLSTGGFTVASPSGQYSAIPVQESGLLGSNGFIYAGERLDLIVIRGQNAWLARAQDGGVSDSGPAQDGEVEIAFADLERVYPSVSFVVYGSPQNGDLLIGLDAQTMAWFTVNVSSVGGWGK